MPSTLANFLSSAVAAPDDFIVGYDTATLNGERRWTVSTLANAVSGIMNAQLDADIANATNTTVLSTSLSAAPFSVKAWVNFNGTGTSTGSNLTIRSCYNITSVVDRGLGQYEVNMSSGLFSDTDYLVHSNIGDTDGAGPPTITLYSGATLTTSSFRLESISSSTSEADRPIVMITVFGN